MEQHEVVNGLGIYGKTGHKIAQLIFKNFKNFNRHYRLWSFSRCEVKPTGEIVLVTSIYRQQKRGHWTSPMTQLPDAAHVKAAFADCVSEVLANYSVGLPSDELLQVYGETKSIIYQARKGELECFKHKLSGRYDDAALKGVYGEKVFKNVVGVMADPLAVEVRTMLADEIAAVHARKEEAVRELRRGADKARNETYKRINAEKAAERTKYYDALNAIDAKYHGVLSGIETKFALDVEAAHKKAAEEIKELRRSTR